MRWLVAFALCMLVLIVPTARAEVVITVPVPSIQITPVPQVHYDTCKYWHYDRLVYDPYCHGTLYRYDRPNRYDYLYNLPNPRHDQYRYEHWRKHHPRE